MKEKFYGAAFNKPISEDVAEFISSIDIDKKLLVYDIKSSKAHAKMLGKCNIIPKKDAKVLEKGLEKLLSRARQGKLPTPSKKDFEDVHSFVNYLLKEEINLNDNIVDKLHAGRSRNEQIVTDTKMYCMDEIDNIINLLKKLQSAVYEKANKYKEVVMPAYTHLQPAQAVTFGHLLCSYLEAIEKDKTRFSNTQKNISVLPLGSGAVRGSTLNIDRKFLAKKLGFEKISGNSIEAVSSRDFIAEILSDIAILSTHLSRIAEDLILYLTYEFSFVKIDDKFLTGSSMMPNKKNADTLELIRGFSASAQAGFVQLNILMKGLASSYNRDMQYDKKPLFDNIAGIQKCLNVLSGIFKSLKVNKKRLKEYVNNNDFIFATDIAEFLIKKGVSYRQAHDTVGKIIKYCLKNEKNIKDLEEKKIKSFSSNLSKEDIVKLTDPEKSIKQIKTEGGTSFKFVNKQLAQWKRRLK